MATVGPGPGPGGPHGRQPIRAARHRQGHRSPRLSCKQRPRARPGAAPTGLRRAVGGAGGAGRVSGVAHPSHLEAPLPDADPHYNADTDTYRVIHRGHDNASAVTNSEGLTVFFDPDTNEVLGFQIAKFSAYYEAHKTPEGEFEVVLPAKVPANLEEEMDFDAEAIRSGVRIAEFY